MSRDWQDNVKIYDRPAADVCACAHNRLATSHSIIFCNTMYLKSRARLMKPFTVIGQRKEDEKKKRLCHIFAASGQFKVQWLRIWFIKEWNGVVRQKKKINFNANEVDFLRPARTK